MKQGQRKNSQIFRQASLFDGVDAAEEERPGLSGGADLRHAKTAGGASELDSPVADLSPSTFRFMSFGSGSSGNCSYVGNERGGFLIDAGVEMNRVVEEMRRNNISLDSIRGICLTHDHGDHISCVYSFLRKYKMALYCTNRVLNGILRRHNVSRRVKDYHVAIYKEIPFRVADFELTAFDVSHDGSCNSGYSIAFGGDRFVVATDLGVVTDRARHYMTAANYLVIESNYDPKMLDEGGYPEHLKSRIRSATGHLGNDDAAAFLKEIYSPALKYVFLCHLSNENNTPEMARAAAEKALAEAGATVGEATDSLADSQKAVQLAVLPRFAATRCFKFYAGQKCP